MDDLGQETFDLAVDVISGQRSKGEIAGHSQVSIWRNWPQTESGQVETIRARAKPDGEPLRIAAGPASDLSFSALSGSRGATTDQVGLVMPTSLCSGQVARLVAEHLDQRVAPADGVAVRISGAYRRLRLCKRGGPLSAHAGHLRHPFTRRAMLLEHAAEDP